MTANPDASPRKNQLTTDNAPKLGPGPRAATKNERRRQKNAVLRGIVPPNKSPIYVRVLSDEVPQRNEPANPHSPLAIVSPAIVPSSKQYRSPRATERGLDSSFDNTMNYTFESKLSSQKPKSRGARADVNKGLGYSSFYQNQKYHIVHDKGEENGHKMSI